LAIWFFAASAGGAPVPDPRHLSNGWNIPSEGYADQPYIVKTDDGAWLCVMTTGKGEEGSGGQHVISMRSLDQGRTWEKPVDIEPASGPEASYAVLLKAPYGRIYAFYNHNTDNVREVKTETGGVFKRVDSLGYYVFKFSDDQGRSWSARRYNVPVREFDCDRTNVYGGKLRFFWNVGRPLIQGDSALLVLHKVGAMGVGFFAQSEGSFLRSPNILTERDPEKIRFETLPDGVVGLRTPPGGGRVAEEQSIVALTDGSMFCVYRTVDGHPCSAYSRDGGHTWTPPAYMTYTPGGRLVKHPRAATFVWKCSNGKYLYWFHNHGGRGFDDRNPVWLSAGVEHDSPAGRVIHWSQPEILLYDDDPFIRISYPDLVEEKGKFYITETQKNLGRVHEIPPALLEGLFNQWENRTVCQTGLVLNLPDGKPIPQEVAMPRLPEFLVRDVHRPDYGGKDLRAGFSLDVWLKLESLRPGQLLLDSRDATGRGMLVATTQEGTIGITLNDGRTESSWDTDAGMVSAGKLQHLVITVDGGPKLITFIVDGVLCDGGKERQFGWGRFSPNLHAPNSYPPKLRIAPSIQSLRLYNRALRTSEAVGNWQAGLPAGR
jgi:hypothetical protein